MTLESGEDARGPRAWCRCWRFYTWHMSIVPQSNESSGLTVVVPEDALRRAKPLPADDEMAIADLTDDEWKSFQKALADQ